ncbi:coiled-coil domain-containing protein 81-like [Myripristis murdjan]|uniref:coiled-coil domain-containing protein 81-like n=1 Tax=Myripristis murdjan TaxID=586833 RepID=UPI0011763AA7|nr:coiled-coil domain-containing protein 81 [Myripristis murdjan]
MTDVLCLLSEADRTAFPALSQLSENDMDNIWSYVSAYIERQMTLQKGVHLAGLGTFTFSQQKLDIGNRFIMIQRPIFLLTEKLSHSQGLKQVRPLAAGDIPVVQLNFAAVSKESPFSRDVVEGCVRESLLLLLRALASQKNVLFTFQGIGVLRFKNNKVRMKFNRDFINAIDTSGRLLSAFSKRLGSSASLISGRMSRLQTPQTAGSITSASVCSPEPGSKADSRDSQCIWPAPDQTHAGSKPAFCTRPTLSFLDDRVQPPGSKSHQTLQPAKMEAVSLSEEPNPKNPMEATDKATVSISPPEGTPRVEKAHVNVSCQGHTRAGQELCYLCMQHAQRNVPVYLREQRLAEEQAQERLLLLQQQQKDKVYMEKEQANMDEQRQRDKQLAAWNLDVSEALKKEKACCAPFHTSFVFPDRPVTPARQIKQRHYKDELQAQVANRRQHDAQDEHNRLLLDYLTQVQLVQEIASKKEQHIQQKHERAKLYRKALDTQARASSETHPEIFEYDRCPVCCCVVQVEAGRRSQEGRGVKLPAIHEKSSQSRSTVQVEEGKDTGLPECQSINLRSDRCETPARNAEARERAQKVSQEQLIAAHQKRREELSKRQAQQMKESEMLKRNRRDLILDRLTRFERRQNVRASLEDSWHRSVALKHHRDDEERRFLRSGGHLLIDQCEQYRRCSQCKRKTSNYGESNIWKDSCYSSGSRLMN